MSTMDEIIMEKSLYRLLAGLLFILMSAIVLAEQTGSLPTYDELTKNTIYGSAGKWRAQDPDEEQEWRAQGQVAGNAPNGGTILEDQSKLKEDPVDSYEFDNTTQGYRLFKIDI